MPLPRAALSALAVVPLLALCAPAAVAKPRVRGSVEQVHVTGAKRNAQLVLRDRRGRRVGRRRAGRLGGAVFRGVKPGRGYRVNRSARVRVLTTRSAPPSRRLYGQKLPRKGYGYLTTRDGTRLAINVSLPAGRSAPYPTLVEYSGYGYADPAGGESSIAAIANLLGYAVVDVNMRGTGCSGGAFDFFEPLQSLDGYDVIETVARQSWVAHGKPGMFGISYGGISQLFVGATRPPHLAAISPLSVLSDTVTTLYPGGILNTGFTLSWAKDRDFDARPASRTGGQRWALDRIRAGDRTCKHNQVLHAEAVNQVAKIRRNDHYVAAVADPLAPVTFVHRIRTPTFLACQFTDEQTGGHCPALARRFTGTSRKWMTFTNGTHTDALDPATINQLFDFLELYVARRAPRMPQTVRDAAPLIFKAAMGIDGVTLPDDPIQSAPNLASARAAFEALPPVRVAFDNGAGGDRPGMPYPGFERRFERFPPPGTGARSWYLAPEGTLTDTAPAAAGADAFTYDRRARPATNFSGDTGSGSNGLWTTTPPYAWSQHPDGTAVSYVTAPLGSDTAVLGAGALTAWITSSAPSVDLQATVSEVRPDGKETFVQSGWLRASERKLDRTKSTELEPVLSLRRRDSAPLPAGTPAKVTVPLYYQGHLYRAGSRLRVTLAAIGGDQPVWGFAEAKPSGTAAVTVLRSAQRPSRLTLPVTPGIQAPTPLPPCPGLRGEPCRDFRPIVNRAG